MPDFKGLKICYIGDNNNRPPPYEDIRRIGIRKNQDRLLFDESAVTGSGGNSGFQALNLAAQWGARRILLFGFDMNAESGAHWYGRNQWVGANNPDETNFRRWRKAFEAAADQLKQMGIECLNCSPVSALSCFPKISIEAL